MTQTATRQQYVGAALARVPDVESQLRASIVEHLASEAALGTVVNVATAMAWLRHTFLFTRMVAAPERYNMRAGTGLRDVEGVVGGLLLEHLRALAVARCITFSLRNDDDGTCAPYAPTSAAELRAGGDRLQEHATRACHVFSRSYLRFETFAILAATPPDVDVLEWFRRIASAREFTGTMIIRREEKVVRTALERRGADAMLYVIAPD